MVRRRLAKAGLAVSVIGLGTTKLGRNTDVKYAAPFALPSHREIEELLASAAALGVNLIDTAPAYGDSEHKLGRLIAKQRNHWLVCTKCGEQYHEGRSIYDFSRKALLQSVEVSLKRLAIDYIDVLLLHSDGHDVAILTETDAVETLLELKKSGKARAIGISAKTPAGIAAAVPVCDVIMAPFNRRDPSLGEALHNARAEGLGIFAIKGLSSGNLKPATAIEFVLRQPFVDSLLVGTLSPEHLREAVLVAEKTLAEI